MYIYIYVSLYIRIYPLQLKPVVCCRSQESVAASSSCSPGHRVYRFFWGKIYTLTDGI